MLRTLTLFDLALIAQKSRSVIDIVISTAVQNYNLWTVASSSPNYVAGKTDINLTIDNTIGSSTVSGNSLSVPNQFTSGDTITITNNSTVIGKGGNGGKGGIFIDFPSPGESVPGSAILAQYPVTIINNGTFAGGGGGGGGGNPLQPSPPAIYAGGGGGGGAGSPGGTGGPGPSPSPGATSLIGSSPGSPGTLTSGGAGGPAGGGAAPGGPGGGQGADGTTTPSTANSPSPIPGGTRGFYASGNPLITWQVTGTRLGRVS